MKDGRFRRVDRMISQYGGELLTEEFHRQLDGSVESLGELQFPQ